MKNPLYKELEDLRYISISSIDPYDIPESVVIYFKNNSEVNKKMSIETIHGTQLDLQNQNPTIVLENYKATFCLGGITYIPVVTIDHIEDIWDPEYPNIIYFTGTVSRTDDFIPDNILVEYLGVSKRADLVTDTTWKVAFELNEVSVDSKETVSVIANSIDVNNPNIPGEFSEAVTSEFNIIFNTISCEGALDTTGCVTLDGIWDVEVDGVVIGTNLSAVNILHTLNALDTFEVTDCSDFSYRLDETNSGKTISLKSTGWDIIAYRENVNDIYNKVSKAKIILKEGLTTLSQITVMFPINSQSIEISIPFTNKLSPSTTLSATIIGIPNE